PKRWRAQEIIRQIEVRMIEHIKSLGSELQINSFLQTRRLHQRHIHVLKSRTVEDVSTRVAEARECRERKRRRVEPLIRSATRKLRAADDVGTIVCAKP